MSDYVIVDGDQVIFMPAFGAATLIAPPPGLIKAQGETTFGGKKVKAGTYSLFTIPGKQEWTVILSSASNVWGSYFYKQEEDVARVTVPVTTNKENLEAFSMAFGDDMTLHMGWGNLRVSVPIQ